jgi:hypothetical protein
MFGAHHRNGDVLHLPLPAGERIEHGDNEQAHQRAITAVRMDRRSRDHLRFLANTTGAWAIGWGS